MKDIVILGGPNGAGKTTAAMVLLPRFPWLQDFLNADEIARGIAPTNPEDAALSAGRLMIERMRSFVSEKRSFAFETTCAGKSYIPMLKSCRQDGLRISLYYFWLSSPDYSIARVAKRVREGGHPIPAEVIRRRFRTGVANLIDLYLPLANEARIYDNSSEEQIFVAEKRDGRELLVHNSEIWSKMKEIASWK
jgi:predicted ABC-type ATPase